MTRKPVLPPTYLWIAVIVMVALNFVLPVRRIISFPWGLLGALPLLVGAALNVIADKALRDARTTVKPFQKSAALVDSSAYRISRHPMYLGFVLILLGLALLLGSLTPFLVIPIFAIVMDRVFIVAEEQMMEETFGRGWLDYKASVRRWV